MPPTDGGFDDRPDAGESLVYGDYDPVVYAQTVTTVDNLEAPIPPQCYTKTDGRANPCWTCHAAERYPNLMGDWDLQEEYAFSDVGNTNHWTNLFVDRTEAVAAQSDEEVLEYVRQDNYEPLRRAMQRRATSLRRDGYTGYIPDIDLRPGFDEEGFARDGSGWRAFRYKPFLGTFWPTNGSTDDVFVRLPAKFGQDAEGRDSREIHKINYAILEAAMTARLDVPEASLYRRVEPIDESLAGIDLDGDGQVSGVVTTIRGLPERYVGGAADEAVTKGLYPVGITFLHSVRYIDPDAPSMIATRMKELRYSVKRQALDRWAITRQYELEYNEKEEGKLPQYGGSPTAGLTNSFGWQIQGFIEDAEGRLRVQTREETRFCMGCHSTIGVTADQTFAFSRKVPGAEGWRYQDIRGIPDVPQYDHDKPEILTYFDRVGGGDEFRANDEILQRFFPNGELDEQAVLAAAPGGTEDITYLIAPSRERALTLNKAYRVIVEAQSFIRGRDATVAPADNVFPRIENAPTDLGERIYRDGRLRLDWSQYVPED